MYLFRIEHTTAFRTCLKKKNNTKQNINWYCNYSNPKTEWEWKMWSIIAFTSKCWRKFYMMCYNYTAIDVVCFLFGICLLILCWILCESLRTYAIHILWLTQYNSILSRIFHLMMLSCGLHNIHSFLSVNVLFFTTSFTCYEINTEMCFLCVKDALINLRCSN